MFLKKLVSKKAKKPFVSAVIVAAGLSSRMGGEDKLLINICGIPSIIHTLLAFEKCSAIDEIILVCSESNIDRLIQLCIEYGINKLSKAIKGANTRSGSVFNGISEVSKACSYVAIHDGARPLITDEIIKSTIKLAVSYKAAAPAVYCKDTIKVVGSSFIENTIDRNLIMAIQTPQVFELDIIRIALSNAIKNNLSITDDCAAYEAIGGKIAVSKGSYENVKLTTPADVLLAEAIMSRRILNNYTGD